MPDRELDQPPTHFTKCVDEPLVGLLLFELFGTLSLLARFRGRLERPIPVDYTNPHILTLDFAADAPNK